MPLAFLSASTDCRAGSALGRIELPPGPSLCVAAVPESRLVGLNNPVLTGSAWQPSCPANKPDPIPNQPSRRAERPRGKFCYGVGQFRIYWLGLLLRVTCDG
jgi:hypothetical protein